MDRLTLLTVTDATAVISLFAAWMVIGWWIERPSARRPSVTILMMAYRRAWMVHMVTRTPRIFDATILDSLRQSTSFFASTCVIAIGGVIALIGNAEQLSGVASDLGQMDVPTIIWEMKLAVVALFLIDGFLKFVWANRLFGYCAVVMAAVPNDASDPVTYPRAAQAADLNIRAAWNFNRGLRSMYFALAALAWLLGPWALIVAVVVTLWLLWSREFRSHSRNVLLQDTPSKS